MLESIQPRTGLSKFAKNYRKVEKKVRADIGLDTEGLRSASPSVGSTGGSLAARATRAKEKLTLEEIAELAGVTLEEVAGSVIYSLGNFLLASAKLFRATSWKGTLKRPRLLGLQTSTNIDKFDCQFW